MTLLEKNIRKEIIRFERINDSFEERYEYLRLDKNERIIPFSNEQMESLKNMITSEVISGYHELGPVYKKLSKFLGISLDQILLAAGSDLAIKTVFETIIERGDNIVLHSPSYAMYKVYANLFGAEIREVSVSPTWELDIESMLSMVNDKTKIFVLENPNGFVGTKPSLETLEFCAKELAKKDVFFVIDEAYIYIENEKSESIKFLSDYPNVLISQTFSKAHGLAGVRVGLLLGNESVMKYFSRVRPMHEISSVSAVSTIWVLDNPELLSFYQKEIVKSKSFLFKELELLNLSYKDTHTNFILVYLPDESRTKGITQKLKDRKILIRRPFEVELLRGWSRVCVGDLNDSSKFINALKDILVTK
ncbi:pyridoxal phosphate-dependent aminotransferase [Leptospira vanthielii]|uniref:Aminotransferase class I/II-fold pyridoxal phosphate-dependent enzyme n=1 Tax=Leptospira vanthielii TaxID=293085 RepID=A0ABY2NSS2_9LEPT|nr:aminotransferase class I/II-fold pyridoxal phosphate-dependent enzyme [Leptospira vanthielii]TGM60677.1 aminotransferase class I/II-fold pyridoxal phosphate-dependent enzyme [Leptospira vanthielii]